MRITRQRPRESLSEDRLEPDPKRAHCARRPSRRSPHLPLRSASIASRACYLRVHAQRHQLGIERPEFGTDLFSHIDQYLAFAVAGSLFGLAYPRQKFFVCILVLGSAVLLELSQLLTPDRHARVIDAVRKIVGGATGIAYARLAISLYRRSIVAGNQDA